MATTAGATRQTAPPRPGMAAVPQPWDYNPSKWSQRVRVSLLAFVGFLIATYMGLYQWGLIESVWDPVFGAQSQAVLNSDVSHTLRRWFIIPDAILGALAYLGDIIFGLAGSTRRWQYRPWLVVLFGIDVIPLGIVSAVLVVLQGAVVGSWCFLCLVTAAISLSLIILAHDEIYSCVRYLYRVWRRSGRFGVLWNTFWGRPSQVAADTAKELVEGRDVGQSH